MKCSDCTASEQTKGHWRQFNSPGCLYCTARLIQQLEELRSPTSAGITARQRAVLADAVAWGHSEQAIRDLVALKEMALQPTPSKPKQLSKK